MLIKQECGECKRYIKVRGDGRLFDHYPKHGYWNEGWCPGSGKTALETREGVDGENGTSGEKP